MPSKIKKQNAYQVLQYIKKMKKQIQNQDKTQNTVNQMNNTIALQHKRMKQVYMKFKVNYLVRLFVQKLKRNLKPKIPIQLTQIQQVLIMKQKQQKQSNTKEIPNILKVIFLILNTICMFIIQIFCLWQGLLRDYRDNVSQQPVILIFKIVCLLVFIVKIGLGMTVQNLVSQTLFIKSRKLIKFYLTSWIFIFDILFFLISLLLIILPTEQILGIIGFVISTTSHLVLYRNLKIIQTFYIDTYIKKQYWNLFQVLLYNIWSLQIYSFIVLAMVNYDDYYNWIQRAIRYGNMMQNPPWYVKYIYSIYWIVCALASLGFGDLVQGSYVQCICMALIVYSGFLALSYNVIQVFHTIQNIRRIDYEKNYDIMIFKRMQKKDKMNNIHLQNQILKYIVNSAQIKNQPQFLKISTFLQKLPPKLKTSFKQQVSKNIFTQISFFSFLNLKTLNALSDSIQRKIYYSGQFIPQKHQKILNISILKHGKIGLAYKRENSVQNGKILQSYEITEKSDPPYLLNQYLFTIDKEIKYDIIAKSYCYLYTIKLQDFHNSLRSNSKDNQLYFYMRDRFLYTDLQWNKLQCQFCCPKKHTVFQCPKLHYMPYKSLTIYRYIFSKSKFQFRKNNIKRKTSNAKKKKAHLYWKIYYKKIQLNTRPQLYEHFHNKNKRNSSIKLHKYNHQETKFKTQKLINAIYQQLFVNNIQIQDQYPLDINDSLDKMYNFDYYFSQHNPNRLKDISLKKDSYFFKKKLEKDNFIQDQNVSSKQYFMK